MPAEATPEQRIVDVIRHIPRGRVATYGQVATLAGLEGRARLVARVLRSGVGGTRLPWHRVVGRRSARQAQISIPDPEGAALQRSRLTREGVGFSDAGSIPPGALRVAASGLTGAHRAALSSGQDR